MKPSIFAGLLTTASVLVAPAIAETGGTISSIGGDDGAVILVRDGQSMTIAEGASVLANDRVVVRGNGEATVNAFGCSKTLAAPAMVVLDTAFCETQVVALPQQAAEARVAASPQASMAAASDSALGAPIAAGAGVASLAALVGNSDGSGSSAAAAAVTADGSTAVDGTVEAPLSPAPVTDTPTSALFGNDSGNLGSGLDTGLFGFFEATSS